MGSGVSGGAMHMHTRNGIGVSVLPYCVDTIETTIALAYVRMSITTRYQFYEMMVADAAQFRRRVSKQ